MTTNQNKNKKKVFEELPLKTFIKNKFYINLYIYTKAVGLYFFVGLKFFFSNQLFPLLKYLVTFVRHLFIRKNLYSMKK